MRIKIFKHLGTTCGALFGTTLILSGVMITIAMCSSDYDNNLDKYIVNSSKQFINLNLERTHHRKFHFVPYGGTVEFVVSDDINLKVTSNTSTPYYLVDKNFISPFYTPEAVYSVVKNIGHTTVEIPASFAGEINVLTINEVSVTFEPALKDIVRIK